jgi:uroporphyrin-III C-methyltransferase/precorrin-2 dehydrogenase/sirohydrochlorin ferrochelatase
VSSAVAGPALSGIPVTHRGIASGFLVLSGHAEGAYRPVLESLAPNSVTVVVLMGLATRARLSEVMLASGWKTSTPAAIAYAATTSRARTWLGRLDQLGGAEIPDELLDAPAALCIGEVVSLAEKLAPVSVVGNTAAQDAAVSSVVMKGRHHGSGG